MKQPTQLKQPQIDLKQTLPLVCEKCGNESFHQAVLLRKINKFLTGQAQDSLLPIPVFACDKCGHVNNEFKPKEILPEDKQ